MYLGIRKYSSGEPHLFLISSIREEGKKHTTKKLIKNLGKMSEVHERILTAMEDKQTRMRLVKVLEHDIEKGNEDEVMQIIRTGEWDRNIEEIEQKNSLYLNFNKDIHLHYGHIVLKNIWDKELNLKYKINYLQKKYTKINTWSLNDLIFYVSILKIIDPKSYHSAYKYKGNFFYCPWSKTNIDNFYRMLDFIDDNMNDLIKHSVKSNLTHNESNIKIAFFDCTNTWFETPYDDVTWRTIRYTFKVVKMMQSNGKTTKEIDEYLEGEEFAKNLANELQVYENEILRMRGLSKEGRYAQPLVTVALVINQEGFPIDFKVFAGNVSELRTLMPVLESLKEKYDVNDIYFVADRGLNSTENIDKIKSYGIGYIVAQKVSGLKENIKNEMLSIDGYKNCIFKNSEWINSPYKFIENAFRYKVCDFSKTAYIEKGDGSKTKSGRPAKHKVTVQCKILYTFSPERKARDLNELKGQVARANKAIADGVLMGNPSGSGWRALIMTEKEEKAADGSKNLDQYRAVGLKKDVIKARTEIAGYAAYIFSHPSKKSELKMSDLQVLTTYHHLVDIEDCFRVMKSKFSIHPVNVRIYKRIRAHCCLCFFALMMMRNIQIKLEHNDISMSQNRISHSLYSALLTPREFKNGELTFSNGQLGQNFYDTSWVGKGRKEFDLNALDDEEQIWKARVQERASMPDDIDVLLKLAGLEPLPRTATMGQVKKLLGIPTAKDSDMLAGQVRKQLEVAY